VRGASEEPLLHLCSENYNLTRRVLAITDHSDPRLALAVERFGRTKPDRLEFIRLEFERAQRDRSREAFCDGLGDLLEEQFPDESLESLTASPDLEHSISGTYARGLLRRGSSHFAVLAVPHEESTDTVESSLTFALLWLDRARNSNRRGTVNALRLILPKGAERHVAHRAVALAPDLSIELYERDPLRETLEKIGPRRAGNQDTWLVPHRESQALLDRARSVLDPIVTLSPRAVTIHPVAQSREVWLRFRGLAFTRWDGGRVLFGGPEAREERKPSSLPALKNLLQQVENYRHPLATETRHALYRAQPERWLEALVGEDVTRVDAALDPRFVYSQVSAHAGGEHGILDLLTVTRKHARRSNGKLAPRLARRHAAIGGCHGDLRGIHLQVPGANSSFLPSYSRYFRACEMFCSDFLQHSRIVFTSPQERILNFSATIRHTPQASLIDLRGRLTFFEVGVLRENVTRLLNEGHKHIVLNLSALQYLDSSGIGELARMYVMVLKGGGEMKVVGLSRNVEEILKVTHLYQVFPEFPDEEAALQSFPGSGSGSDKSPGNT
jgi:anti-sigma B factor antagonist